MHVLPFSFAQPAPVFSQIGNVLWPYQSHTQAPVLPLLLLEEELDEELDELLELVEPVDPLELLEELELEELLELELELLVELVLDVEPESLQVGIEKLPLWVP